MRRSFFGDLARRVGQIVFTQRLAHIHALRGQKGIGHATTDHEDVDLFHKVAQEIELGGDLGPPDHRHHGAGWVAKRSFQRGKLGLHQAPGTGGQAAGQPLGRGMGAVGGRKRIVAIDIAKLGHGVGQCGVILGLAGFKAGVFQQKYAPSAKGGSRGLCRRPGAFRSKIHRRTKGGFQCWHQLLQ